MRLTKAKVIGFLAICLLIYFVVTQPITAAGDTKTIGSWLRMAADSIVCFFTELTLD
jgi:hypothetical protein